MTRIEQVLEERGEAFGYRHPISGRVHCLPAAASHKDAASIASMLLSIEGVEVPSELETVRITIDRSANNEAY